MRFLQSMSPSLFEAAGDGSGGGGTAAITEERINAMINGAMGRFKTEIPTMFKDILTPMTEQFSTIADTVTALSAKVGTTPAAAGAAGAGSGATGADATMSPEIKAQMLETNRKLEQVSNQLAAEKTKREEAELNAKNTDKASKVRSALNQHTFASPEAAEDAFSLIVGQVEFDANGKLVADGLPVDDFVKDYLPSKKPYLLASTGKNGAGASAGSARSGAGAFQMESIKSGMSPEDQSRAAGAIRQALSNG